MRLLLLLGLLFLTSDRDELLASDRALARSTLASGVIEAFLPALERDAAYLHPGAPLLRGSAAIRQFLTTATPLPAFTWTPVFADISADGSFGYTFGWTRSGEDQGKYLACWRKQPGGKWLVVAYMRTPLAPDTTNAPPQTWNPPAHPVRGRADSRELLRADSAFASHSVLRGAKDAFLAFAADDAVGFGSGPQFTVGRQAIGAGFDAFPAGAVLEWAPVAADIAPSGDLGCTVGEAVITARNHYTKYLTVWKRQPNGEWMFVADGGNVRPGATGTPPPED